MIDTQFLKVVAGILFIRYKRLYQEQNGHFLVRALSLIWLVGYLFFFVIKRLPFLTDYAGGRDQPGVFFDDVQLKQTDKKPKLIVS